MAQQDDPWAGSVWARDPRPAADRRDGLTRAQIVAAAIELLDAEGPAGLSMRKLAQRVGSGTTSAYWHVANKGELLDLALDKVMAETHVTDEPTAAGWRAAAAAYAHEVRDMFRRHPWVVTVVGDRPMIGPNATRMSDRMLGVMTAAGFSLRDGGYAASSLTSFALGHAVAESAQRASEERGGLTDEQTIAAVADFFTRHADAFPNLAAWVRENGPGDADRMRDETFEFGLQRHLDGLGLLLERQT